MASSSNPPESPASSLPGEKDATLQRLWLSMLTRNLRLIAGTFGVVMFVGSVGFDLVFIQHEATLAIVISNGLVALLASSLTFALLAYGREQRRRLMQRMEALQEVNHHIRNALQALSFTAGALQGTKEAATVTEAIRRIQWALAEVLPKIEPAYEPFEGSARNARGSLRRDLDGR